MASANARPAVEEAHSNPSAPNPAGHSQFIKDPLAHFKAMPCRAGPPPVLFNTTFRKAVMTPQVVLVRGRVVKRGGRKITVRGSIKDKDGKVLGEGEGVWVKAGKQLRSHL
ncbi:hypothetical protein B0T26DRAFT_673968 [Lasiosphaeria miniovina]|uniref:Thioesterase domain-containing protein n=1 Tax=Lasiosphaeria miniovina TaxID=1954250 RepID=A0AA40AUL4_9PEZI|nr:uncharacterized protein B0T26DRAFT_673968 [Lasiosphaeria miniovina]KAK0722246.1 hypothetical protein B0T26DRAFT_673968 [Lasiosphaeria miniovina]